MRTLFSTTFVFVLFLNCSDSTNSNDLSSQLGIGNPVITEIDPPSGAPPIGTYAATTVTITGRHFAPSTTDSIITFHNGVRATVLTATTTQLTTTVPAGATSGLLYVSKTGGSVCDPLNGDSAYNCYAKKFYIDCYKSYNGAYGDENGVTYPDSKTVEYKEQVATKAYRIDLNTTGATNVKIGCDTFVAISYFTNACVEIQRATLGNPSTWEYQPTITFPSYYTVQMFITAGKGNCTISFP
ncbi:DNA-binding protein [Leptospira perolatii]|uniref:DNA-binding protein n=2 Tax=Leptospira perolatii TaxID=2023191 RepID=A0A2M9ZR66_9LEPT|nr:DNA-binding protein [Leptospira perolatii]PJZ74552.1 DNA-binding protein [Leptospira perolatii]